MKSFYIKSSAVTAIFCLGILVYSNTFFCSFHFDDFPSIIDNAGIRNIYHLQNIWDFWPCRFLTYLSFALNYHWAGVDVFGYHLFNLAVHLASAILLWWLVRLTFLTPVMRVEKIASHSDAIALFAGLIFVVHPIQTQAVTYIVQRAASMASLFYLASLCFYIKSRSIGRTQGPPLRIIFYTCSLITAVGAMFTKEITITLPLMILLYEFSFLRVKRGINWSGLIPFLFTLLIIPLTMLLTQSVDFKGMHRMSEEAPGISSIHYLLTQFRVMITYIRLAFFPVCQNLDYDYPIFKSIFELPVLTSLFFSVLILFCAKRLFLKYRLVSFSILWFFLTLLPESSVIPIKDLIYEHRLYLPLAGYCLLLVSGLYYLTERFHRYLKAWMVVVVLIATVACYSILTYQRNKVWINDFALWNDAAIKSPHKARVHCNRGIQYTKQNNLVRAIADFDKAIELDPNYTRAYFNRAISYDKEGNFEEAIADYNKAIEINPDLAETYYKRGLSYEKKGDFTQAISDYNRGIELDPSSAEAFNNRGVSYAHQGDFTQAISDLTQAIKVDPSYKKAYYNRGLVYARLKNFDLSIADYNKDIEVNPKDAQAYNDRAIIYYQLGKYDKAWDDLHKAQELGVVVIPQFISALKAVSGKAQ